MKKINVTHDADQRGCYIDVNISTELRQYITDIMFVVCDYIWEAACEPYQY